MSRPLWEAYIIEGLDNIPDLPKGSFAVYTKMHHSLVDGGGGANFMAAIHDLEPSPPKDAPLLLPAKPQLPDISATDVHLLGRKPHADLPAYCKAFDVGQQRHRRHVERSRNPRAAADFQQVAEQALAHALPSAVEAVYRRSDLFDKRANLMRDWAKFCAMPRAKGDNVKPLRGAKA